MNALDTLIRELERDESLDSPARLRLRLDALDRLETLLPEPSTSDTHAIDAQLRARAAAMRDRLETINAAFFRAVREDIQRGDRPAWLMRQVAEWRAAVNDRAREERYGHLDAAVSEILRIDAPDADDSNRTDEMVFYQPTPARHIFDLIARAELTERDVLVDLGSGLGHVSLLTAVCTNARTIGIEREAAYVDCARRCADAMNLRNVSFVQQDARDADFSVGTLFYFYTPFTGSILRTVLDSLRTQATMRLVRVGAYGPCVAAIARERWLEVIGAARENGLALFRSR